MHGIIHLELERFVVASYGVDAWRTLVERAALGTKVYTPLAAYPDDEILRLVSAASVMTGRSATDLLEAFGEALVPAYVNLYGSLLSADWRTLDVIEHTEETIHRVVRRRQPGAEPPRLKVTRPSKDEAVLFYDSPRRLCAVARGIAQGLAKHFAEHITATERWCMHRGDPECVIVFRAQRP